MKLPPYFCTNSCVYFCLYSSGSSVARVRVHLIDIFAVEWSPIPLFTFNLFQANEPIRGGAGLVVVVVTGVDAVEGVEAEHSAVVEVVVAEDWEALHLLASSVAAVTLRFPVTSVSAIMLDDLLSVVLPYGLGGSRLQMLS